MTNQHFPCISDWTTEAKLQKSSGQLADDFWAHITAREKKSKAALERATRVGEKLTVSRRWFGKSA